jgi:hypothetical protein
VLEETVAGHATVAACDVAVDGEDDGVGMSVLACRGGDEPGIGDEKRAHAIPVAGLPFAAGDDVVDGSDDGIRGFDVFGFGCGPVGMAGDGANETGRSGCWRR